MSAKRKRGPESESDSDSDDGFNPDEATDNYLSALPSKVKQWKRTASLSADQISSGESENEYEVNLM